MSVIEEADRSLSLITTHDFDEAHERITQVYIPHGLESRDGRPLDFKLRYLASDRLTIGHLRYGADAELLVPPMESCYHVNLTLSGETMVTQAGQEAATKAGRSGVVFSPDDPFTVRWSPDATQYAIKIPRSSLEGALSQILGKPVDEPIKFDLGFDLTGPTGQSLVASVQHLRKELTREGGLARFPLVRAQLETYVLSQLLLTIPHNHHEAVTRVVAPARRRHIQLAVDFIERHAGDPITTQDVAAAACVSLRALQAGFQQDFGMPPTAYLRNVRLERVRSDLMSSTPEDSVGTIAMRWGFWHLGRFADQYRRKFGELPSETLNAQHTRT